MFGAVSLVLHAPLTARASWCSKLQPTVATSTAEAEMCSSFFAAQEVLYLYNILNEMNIEQSGPIQLFVDNQACIASSKNVSQSSKTKHVALKHCFLNDLFEKQQLTLVYRPTNDMPADLLTKNLGRQKVQKFTQFLMGIYA